ncbi:hypothetical protein [Paracholeplasma manati]|uniref:hypothetical protein n=1 Tax=Paracholeplasma manati TaxID=591373 RepID=UPI0024082254|nr:hypothetical protein [Paracholeplasma manati]MDG0888949.1 hypothetical protein [Paracholeplasma manati]
MNSSEYCVVLPCNINIAPYYQSYERLFISKNLPFDLIIWDRELSEEQTFAKNVFKFSKKDIPNNKNWLKIISYFKFASFVKNKLKKNSYKKVIFLSTSGATVVLLNGFLKKYYNKKYWIDIRDYSFEWFIPYKNGLAKAIDNSFKTSISSPAFTRFLPKGDFSIVHNIDFKSIDDFINHQEELEQIDSDKIRISFVGSVRYFEENKKQLEFFKNDTRYVLQFYGSRANQLKGYCEDNNIHNVDFHDRFDSSETYRFYQRTDIINNVYGNNSFELTTALSNKLYFSVALKKPIIVSSDTYLASIVVDNGFGYVLKYVDEDKDNLYKWYFELINSKDYHDKCNDFYNNAVNEYKANQKLLEDFLHV